MPTVTVFTAERMLEIEEQAIVGGTVDGTGHLILTRNNAATIDAGLVKGADGSSSLATLPAGVMIVVDYTSGTGPARPTARTDLVVRWRGPNAPANAISGDEFLSTV